MFTADWKTTLLGILAGGLQVGKSFVKPEYQAAVDAGTGVLLGLLGFNAADKLKQ